MVSIRAIAAQVAAICGEPAYVDHWTFEEPVYGQIYGPSGPDSEVWYYNFGANQLLRLLRFRNGRLIDIDTDGYGFNVLPDGHCGAGDIVLGESKYRLLLTCGDPVAHRAGSTLRSFRPSNGYEPNAHSIHDDAFTPVYREELTYNFGSGARLRTAVLENGWVVDITDGDRGFDPG